MALDQSALLEVLDALRTADAGERITQAAETIYQALIDAELTAFIGASPHERTETRSNQRNGSRPRTLSTVAGDLELRIPKLRTGSFFPALLERRRRVDQCLFAVVMEAYLHGTSTRKVDDLVKALGTDTGISKSEVSRICKDLDTEVAAFRDRPLGDQRFPYVFLDATYCKARVNHRVVSQAVVIATGVAADGRREVLGFEVGDSEDGAFWTAFLRSLKSRGLAGVQLVISDAHAGLRSAIDAVLIGAAWQRCRVHFLRNVLAQVPKGSAEMVAAAIRTVFAQPDAEHVREQLDTIAGMLGRQFPKVETMLREAAADITAFADFPVAHWKKIWSTNPRVICSPVVGQGCDLLICGVDGVRDVLLALGCRPVSRDRLLSNRDVGRVVCECRRGLGRGHERVGGADADSVRRVPGCGEVRRRGAGAASLPWRVAERAAPGRVAGGVAHGCG
ncbi:transposase, Mutator family protein [Mycobacterium avium MAV_120709_2344]|nr:transposase, Mutator family protein [Mycobacterium avium MAV_120709_2344]